MTVGRSMTESLSSIRERVHRKSHAYFVFEYGRREREKWRMFYGAMDALLDAGTAAASYGSAVTTNEPAKLLACYGFLQALYVQQDAVIALSRAVGLGWHPNDDKRLKEIRDARNRLTGHPALAGEHEKPRRLSSAIIPYVDITQSGFRGHVYYDDGFEDIKVEVEVFQNDNEKHLCQQMQLVENRMDEQEHKFRTEQATRPLSLCFGSNFEYILQRLHCDLCDEGRLVQAQAHAQMIRSSIISLQKELTCRGFCCEAQSLKIVFTGLDLLESIMTRNSSSITTQHEFDLIYDGLEKNILEIKTNVAAIDSTFCAPVG